MPPSKKPIILTENRITKDFWPRERKVLEEFFYNNLVEVVFRHRILPPWFKKYRKVGHASYYRRMLCTSNWKFIFSSASDPLFKLPKPKQHKGKEYYRKHNMIITFDIFMLNWRIVSLDKYRIVGFIPLQTLEQRAKFIAFYRQYLKNLPEGKKLHFSDI